MSKWIEEREDGSLAFYIDGDLQFDSGDERNYHEPLVLPALALARKRHDRVRALIVGGGDGLSARELLKASAVEHVDLVDYDAEVLDLARTAFAPFNYASLSDERLHAHVEDAWGFVEEAVRAGTTYDVIVVDLTVAQDLAGAKFHSVDWYDMLRRLLGEAGVLATNGVSPSATPEAYFCIFNGIRSAGLHAVPYRTFVPSFTKLGYGPDWGFILASSDRTITDCLRHDLHLEASRLALRDCDHLRKLFTLPEEVFEYQADSIPAGKDSEVLLNYLYNADDFTLTSNRLWNALDTDLDGLELPDADLGGHLLPSSIRGVLADDQLQENLFIRVLELMPALHKFHTRQIIADFLDQPAAFLESIDLVALVDELMRRAAELPQKIVTELKLLQEKLVDWAGDHISLLQLGSRITTVVAVVVILGNLIYPDAVYGKGEGHGGAGHIGAGYGHAAGRGDRGGDRGDRDRAANHEWNRGDNWGHWNAWGGRYGQRGGWARPWHRWWGGGWGGWVGWAPWAGWGIPVATGVNMNFNQSVDEQGNQYPPRVYNYNPTYVTQYVPENQNGSATTEQLPGDADDSPAAEGETTPDDKAAANTKGVYRLGPDTDILPDGRLVMRLTSSSYLLVTNTQTQVVDQATGAPMISLFNDPSLRWHLANEMTRQQKRLEVAAQAKVGALDSSDSLSFQQQSGQSQDELTYMKKIDGLLATAQQKFGSVPQTPPPPEQAPLTGAIEIFTSVWMTPDGSWLLVKRADGSLVHMNGHGWYSDAGKTKLSAPYPEKFKSIVTAYLTNLTRESASVTASIAQDKQEAQQRMDKLNQDLQTLIPPENAVPGIPTEVQFGADTVAKPEALRRTKLAIRRAQHRLDFLNKELQSIPAESAAATAMLAHLGAQG